MLKYHNTIGPDKQILYSQNLIISNSLVKTCFGCSKEPSQRDGSFEYPQDVLVEK